jgi:RNA polymerase sigma factor (sigma-70 family)
MNLLFNAGTKLTKDEQLKLHRKMKRGCLESRNKLVESVIYLCIDRAKFFFKDTIPDDDLISEACLAAIKAVDDWNPKKGALSTVCCWYIRNHIIKYLAYAENGPIRIPAGTLRKTFKVLNGDAKPGRVTQDAIRALNIRSLPNKSFSCQRPSLTKV